MTMATQARSIASLTISFGLVAIPVKLYSATVSSERISFNLLRQKDGSRVKQQYVAVSDGQIVERSEMVKGYEFSKDQYVMFSAEELKALEDTTSHAIDIGQFVPLESVDPLYFDGTYYLAPDKGGAKPYTLLATALRKSRQCAVGRWISRGKEHIVVIRPIEDGLALHQLHFKAEVRDLKDLGIEAAPVSEPELKLAQQLIEHLAAKRFDPNEYADEHRARVQAAIQKKVEGKEVSQGRQCHRLDGSLESEHRCARLENDGSEGAQGTEARGCLRLGAQVRTTMKCMPTTRKTWSGCSDYRLRLFVP
jgi:DNA end-binding protein Ku